jgi:hypothetical protein
MKYLVSAFLLLISVCQLHAQYGVEFMHAVGGKYFFYPNAEGLSSTSIVYSPRINLTSTESNSISVGTHFGIGFSVYSGPGGSQRSLALDLPLVGEFNFGHGSTFDNESAVGGYVGAGYGIHRISMAENDISGSATLHGPVFTGGIRFTLGRIGSYDLGATYMVNTNKDYKTTPFGISISYTFGMDSYY